MTSRAGGFLYWCAGAEPAYLNSRTERAWYQAIGLSVVLTAMASTVSLTFALTLSLGGQWWSYAPFSLLWGLFVFNMDRWLVSTIHYGRLDETNTGQPRVTTGLVVGYLARFLFAGILAVVIAEPIVLQIFYREIDQQVAADKAAAVTEAERAVRARPEIVAERDRIDTRQQTADDELVAAQKGADDADKALDDEISGNGGTGQAGCGRRCAERREDARNAKTRLEAAKRTVAKVVPATDADNLQLEERVAQLVAVQAAKIDGGDGLLAREKALTELMREHPELATRRWFVSLLFLVIDLVPLLLKTFGPATNHDRDVRLAAVAHATAYGLEYWKEHASFGRDRALNRARLEHGVLTEQDRLAAERWWREVEMEHDRLLAGIEGKRQPEAVIGMPSAPVLEGSGPPVAPAPAPGRSADVTWPGPVPPAAASLPPGPDAGPRVVIVGGRWVLGPPLLSAELGGFGWPFQAHDIADPSVHAVLKRIRPSDSDPGANERALRYLRREQKMQCLVDSPFVAPVLDAGDDPRFGPYLATPHYMFGTVHRRIHDADFTPTLEWALRIAGQVLTGLIDCHEQAGLIHLDIKPSNIALDDDGNVQLIDFGLARSLEDADAASSATPAFTRWYAAPEQIQRITPPDWKNSAADVHAVGATLYEIICGTPPLRMEAEARGIDVRDPGELYRIIEVICDPAIRPARLDAIVIAVPGYVAELVDCWLSADPRLRAPGSQPFAVQNAAAALALVQDRVHDEGLDALPVGPACLRDAEDLPVAGPRVNGAAHNGVHVNLVVPMPRGRHAANPTIETEQEPQRALTAEPRRRYDGTTED